MFKRLILSALGAASLLCASLAAQAQVIDPKPTDPLATRDSYFVVTRGDIYRKCPYTLCGGYFVKSVNQALTRCADGTMQKECHAIELNTTALGWTDEQRAAFDAQFSQGLAIVRATLDPEPRGLYTGDVLNVSEAWQGQATHKGWGDFFRVKDTGIRCIAAPCPSLGVTKLNVGKDPIYASDIDLQHTGASKTAVAAGQDALYSTGILANGALGTVKIATPQGGTVRGKKFLASQFYLPAKP